VRQHVFWMFRFVDPKLFPNDPIADYFQSIAPPGFSAIYRLLAASGIDPLLASKILPFALGLVTAAFVFGIALKLLRSSAAASLATILLCQCLYLSSDLCSATPRAFFYPLFAGFFYYHVTDRRIAVLLTLFLLTLFFPPAALVSLAFIVFNLDIRSGWPTLARQPRAYLDCAVAAGIILLSLLSYLHGSGRFGPIITYGAARHMPEFAPGGRVPFFYQDFWDYWMHGAGGLHIQSRPSWLFAALLWPVLAIFPRAFPLLNRFRAGARPLLPLAASALFLFAMSHLLLFRLYLPSRYTQHIARIVFAVGAAAVIIMLVDALLRLSAARSALVASRFAFAVLSGLLLFWIICSPFFLSKFPQVSYITGNAPDLYRFFAAQPSTIRIASIADEANNLPTLCRRSIIFGVETAVPFHPGYYLPLRERGLAIAQAQYSPDLAVVQKCIREQQIDFWLLDRGAFTAEHLRYNRVLRQLRQTVVLSENSMPFLEHPPAQCVAFADTRFVVLDARALLAL
jgi:hypothetical protein